MKLPIVKLQEVEAPWTRWRRQFNAFLARKKAEAEAQKVKEFEDAARRAAEIAASAPQPIGNPPAPAETAALLSRLEILENAWNAFHQSRTSMELLPAEHEAMLQRISVLEARLQPGNLASDTDHEAFRQQVVDLWNAIHRVENGVRVSRLEQEEYTRVTVSGLQVEIAELRKFALKTGNMQDSLAQIRNDVSGLYRQIGELSTLSERGAVATADAVAAIRTQLDALKLKVAAGESEDQATRAGLLALQERQDTDEQHLADLRKELEMEVVGDPKR